eukprot:scaffold13796_cov118-Isochrysis_galbana.AAC.5
MQFGARLDNDVSLRLLGLDVRRKVGLAVVDGLLHLLHGGAALGDVALRLPGELDVVGDVQVDGQVEGLVDALVVHGVQALEDDDRGRGDLRTKSGRTANVGSRFHPSCRQLLSPVIPAPSSPPTVLHSLRMLCAVL